MADDINKIMIVGRLTRDAELMYTNSGYALCKFSIAVNRRKKQGEQWVDEANYFDLNLWGKRGESLNQYLLKGTQLAIEGQLKQERWEQDGAKRSKVTIEVGNVQLLGGKPDNQGGGYNQPQGGPQYQSRSQEFIQYQLGQQRDQRPQQGPPADPRGDQSYDARNNPKGYERYQPPAEPQGGDDIPF